MPNVTISVSDELKTEMDKLSEVNWSEVCRNAIFIYMEQRKNPTPKIELDLRSVRLTDYDFQTGYPAIIMDIKLSNKLPSEIIIDRMFATARFIHDLKVLTASQTNNLKITHVPAYDCGLFTFNFTMLSDKLNTLRDEFNSSFECTIEIEVYVSGFKNSFSQTLQTTIAIDAWQNLLNKPSVNPKQAQFR